MITRRICAKLLAWFADHQRPLPWRGSYQPYQVWIAEIMGQQTQMERVAAYFQQWMARFPDIRALAAASEQEVFKAWEGLGYYSRARNIRKAAEIILREHGGELPRSQDALLALPGIGPYTAAAICSIAYNQPVPLADANVERLLCRIEDIDTPPKQSATRKRLLQLCAELLPPDNARDFNQALMELGALVCTPKNPACAACPLKESCHALAAGTVRQRPVPVGKPEKLDIVMACGIIEHQGQVYIQQRLAEDVWGGLWEFPGGRLKSGEMPEQAARREIAEKTGFHVTILRPFAAVRHQYTKHRVTLHGFFCALADGQVTEPVLCSASQFGWVRLTKLYQFAFPAGHRQLVEKIMLRGDAGAKNLLPQHHLRPAAGQD